jgi:hypothetical protein
MRMLKSILIVLLLSVSGTALAQFKKVETKDFKLVYYDFSHQYLVNHTLRTYTTALRYHEKKFGYKYHDRITILMEDLGDYGNAGASSVPSNIVLMGIAPFKHVYETNATNERINVLANHELVHIVALDMANKNDRLFRKFFGGKVDPDQYDPISMFYGYLTAPRRYSPRWYHEGIAEFMTTWMAGGIGRVMGSYDEMRFRAMVRDGDHIYDAMGLESEGTTVDFEVGANSYMYGTRFMSYLAYTYGPESLITWVARTDSSKSYYARQFKNVYGKSLDHAWTDWIAWEKEWQEANLDRIRENPTTQTRAITNRPLGGVSRPQLDSTTGNYYLGIAYPGSIAHIAEFNPKTGTTNRLIDVEGAALHFVTSIAFEPKSRVLLYNNDNGKWRDLMSFDLATKKKTRLIKDARVGDLVINPADQSLWGIRHLNGISSIVRIPAPYTDWNLVYAMDYGYEAYDIDISPDGKWLSGAVSDLTGSSTLRMWSIEELMKGKVQPKILGDFEENSPSAFTFSPDGNFLYGSTYYTGVSNIVRYDIENERLEWLSNAESGLFRPTPVSSDSLMAFEYTSKGFLPVMMGNQVQTEVSAIEYLGNTMIEKHPQLADWASPAIPPSEQPMSELITAEGKYHGNKEMRMTGSYPIVQGYKDAIAGGVRLDFSDPFRFSRLNLSLSWSPDASLPSDERIHAAFNYENMIWGFNGSYNGADFYDLFGPTKTSRRGYSLGTRYKKILRYEPPLTSEFNASLTYYGNLERLPEYQNVTTSFGNFATLTALYQSNKVLSSLGAVEAEKGIRYQFGFLGNSVPENIGDQRVFFPRVYQNLDLGTPFAIPHSSLWLRTSLGYSFSPKREPLGNFYLGGFGNNWIDHKANRRYRTMSSFPGVDLNAIGGTNYAKLMGEWVMPPIRFKRLGFMSLYSNWAQLSLFNTALVTNIGSPVFKTSRDDQGQLVSTRERHSFYNAGAQLDIKLVVFSVLDATMSFGYASAFDLDLDRKRTDEWMISLKLLR